MQMKLIKMTCANCGAQLELDADRRQAFCTYCGTKLYLDDGGINVTNRIIDEARLKEAEVRLKELEYQHERDLREETILKEQKKADRLSVMIILIALAVTLLVPSLRPMALLVIIAAIVLLSRKRTGNSRGSDFAQYNYSSKSRMVALLLCLLLGVFGIHRFYVGKAGTGILYFFTVGGFGIGWLIDLICILCGVFRDCDGNYVRDW